MERLCLILGRSAMWPSNLFLPRITAWPLANQQQIWGQSSLTPDSLPLIFNITDDPRSTGLSRLLVFAGAQQLVVVELV